jgi:hypothetical protein
METDQNLWLQGEKTLREGGVGVLHTRVRYDDRQSLPYWTVRLINFSIRTSFNKIVRSISYKSNLVDLFTKSLPHSTFYKCVDEIDMCHLRDLQGLGGVSS